MRGQIENDRRRSEDQREDEDQNPFDDSRVAEKDDEPIEDEPHRTKPEEQRQEQQRNRQHRHRPPAHSSAQHLSEVVRHRASISDEEDERENHGGQRQRHQHHDQRIGAAQQPRAILRKHVRVAAKSGRDRLRPILLIGCRFCLAERDGRRSRIE